MAELLIVVLKLSLALTDCYSRVGKNTSFLSFKKNDLIILQGDATGDSITNAGWCTGLCERTGLSGDLPAECVYVLPIINKPTVDILVR